MDFGRRLKRQRLGAARLAGARREYLSSCRRCYSDTFKIDQPAFILRFVSFEGGLGAGVGDEKNRQKVKCSSEKREREQRAGSKKHTETVKFALISIIVQLSFTEFLNRRLSLCMIILNEVKNC